MSKVIMIINTMVINKSLLKDVRTYKGIYLFKFQNHIWSIANPSTYNDDFELVIYPGYNEVADVIRDYESLIASDSYVKYRNEDFKTREATESFKELYNTIKEKLYNIEDVFDDILGWKKSNV